MNVEILVVG